MDAYIYQADLHCEDCIIQIKGSLRDRELEPEDTEDEYSYDSDDYPKGPYANGGGESDSPQHCGSCGLFLKNPLTKDGQEHVDTAFREYWLLGHGNKEVLAEWADYYGTLTAQAKDWK